MFKSFYSLLHFNHPSHLLEGFLTHILGQQRQLTESQRVKSQTRKTVFTAAPLIPTSWASLHLQRYLMIRLEGISEEFRGLCGEKGPPHLLV